MLSRLCNFLGSKATGYFFSGELFKAGRGKKPLPALNNLSVRISNVRGQIDGAGGPKKLQSRDDKDRDLLEHENILVVVCGGAAVTPQILLELGKDFQ